MINIPQITVGSLPECNALWRQDSSAVVCGEGRITWGELNSFAVRFGNALRQMGVKAGDRVALIASNSISWPVIYYGSAKIGTYFCAIPPVFSNEEKRYCLDLARPSVLVVDEQQHDFLKQVRPQISYVKHFMSISEKGNEDLVSVGELIRNSTEASLPAEIKGNDICDILFTTGTTGLPKAPAFTHQSVVWKAISSGISYEYSRNSTVLASGPLFHAGALSTVLNPTSFLGGTAIFLPKFSTQDLLATIVKNSVTHVAIIAVGLLRVLQEPNLKKYDLGSVRVLVIAGGALPEERMKQTLDLFPAAKIKYTLGLTEGMVTFLDFPVELRNDAHLMSKLATQGLPAYGLVRVKAVDEAGNEVPRGTVGEMLFRSPGMPCCYWGRDDLTRELLENGWVHTGDMINIDEDGYIRFVDRKKDIIKTGGENIYAPEVENILYKHQAVADAAVIGLPDEQWGEVVTAVVQLKPGRPPDERLASDLITFCKSMLPGYRCPKKVIFVDGFPRSAAVGKILKRELRNSFLKEKGRM